MFFNFHHGSSELNSFVEVLKNLLFDGFNIFFFINSSTICTYSVLICSIIFAMSALNPRQFVFVFIIFSVFETTILAEPYFELLNLSVKVINDVFIFTNMQSYKFFVSNRFCFDIFSSVCVL